MTIRANTLKTRIAVLGPLGTYTHEAAHKVFGDSVDYDECKTILDTFQAVQETVQIGVVPQENTICGNVIETYDVLRQPTCGFVEGEVTLKVQHCLLVQKGVGLHEIEEVLSHEQALGQCQEFLDTHLPQATRIKTSSTALAARTLQSSPRNCAAICSKICATLFDGLEVLHESIQKEAVNFTRFYIIARDRTVQLPLVPHRTKSKALFRFTTLPPTEPGSSPEDIVRYLVALGLCVARMDRRPSDDGRPFRSTYFIEAIDVSSQRSWPVTVEHAADRVRQMGVEVDLIGLW